MSPPAEKRQLYFRFATVLRDRLSALVGEDIPISPSRRRRIWEVINERTLSVVPVIENVFDVGNVNAVLRSAEALGFQNVHIIKGEGGFRFSGRTTQGAHRWLDINRWKRTEDCINHLKQNGYRILATAFEDSVSIEEIDFTIPSAIVFGNEMEGVSESVLRMCDMRCHVPMLGFTQSFNVSVASALTLYHIYHDRVKRVGSHGDLSTRQKDRLLKQFTLYSSNLRGRGIEWLID